MPTYSLTSVLSLVRNELGTRLGEMQVRVTGLVTRPSGTIRFYHDPKFNQSNL